MKIGTVLVFCALFLVLFADLAQATMPPRQGADWPQALVEGTSAQPRKFTYSRALKRMVRRVRANRVALSRGDITRAVALAQGGLAVKGTRSIPVLMARFLDSAVVPYQIDDLQTQLFAGPWPSGTLTQYYEEVSYGQFSVNGKVFDWHRTAQEDSFYEGKAGCNGVCSTGNVEEFLKEIMDLNDPMVDFTEYDNDGADGIPNSGDDDGYVDFLVFVHPESGGECGNNNLWSHRSSYSSWAGNEYVTNDAKHGGGYIRIDDYVVMPALACDGVTMIQIGVFAHEFGHAFGLPDLYDTDDSNGSSNGIGTWGLMAAGSWGGDGMSPQSPTHMSAWSKEFLGWIDPTNVTADLNSVTLKDVETSASALRIPINANEYYLVSNRQQKLFDINLPWSGMLIWHINRAVVNLGLVSNLVNADHSNKGVDLEEADGRNDLDNSANMNFGDAGDVFPGSTQKQKFDSTSMPSSSGSVAVCDISKSGELITARLLITTSVCSTIAQVAAAPQQYHGEELELQGHLRNEGHNYFTDLRIILQDSTGRKLTVRPWLPIHMPSGPGISKRPDVLSSYLGKQVRLVAVLEKGFLKHFGETYYLDVKTAKIVK